MDVVTQNRRTGAAVDAQAARWAMRTTIGDQSGPATDLLSTFDAIFQQIAAASTPPTPDESAASDEPREDDDSRDAESNAAARPTATPSPLAPLPHERVAEPAESSSADEPSLTMDAAQPQDADERGDGETSSELATEVPAAELSPERDPEESLTPVDDTLVSLAAAAGTPLATVAADTSVASPDVPADPAPAPLDPDAAAPLDLELPPEDPGSNVGDPGRPAVTDVAVEDESLASRSVEPTGDEADADRTEEPTMEAPAEDADRSRRVPSAREARLDRQNEEPGEHGTSPEGEHAGRASEAVGKAAGEATPRMSEMHAFHSGGAGGESVAGPAMGGEATASTLEAPPANSAAAAAAGATPAGQTKTKSTASPSGDVDAVGKMDGLASRTDTRADARADGARGESRVEGGSNEARVRLIQRVARAFQRLGPDGGRVQIMLHPAELGSVRLDLTVEGNRMDASMRVENEAALEVMREHLPQLRQRLVESGLAVERIEVELADEHSTGDSRTGNPWAEHRGGAEGQENRQRNLWRGESVGVPPAPGVSRSPTGSAMAAGAPGWVAGGRESLDVTA